MLELLRIERWDYLLVGDGSCTRGWLYEAGFACMMIPRSNPGNWQTYHGAFSLGTNIVAEMMAYVLPLMHLSNSQPVSVRRVHIVTDCEYLVKASREPSWQKKANSELWTALKAFKKSGLVLHWHWIPRDTIDLNKFSHNLANLARVAMQPLADEALGSVEFETIDANTNEEE